MHTMSWTGGRLGVAVGNGAGAACCFKARARGWCGAVSGTAEPSAGTWPELRNCLLELQNYPQNCLLEL